VDEASDDHPEFPTGWARSPAGRAARSAILRLGFAPLLRFETDVRIHGADVFERIQPPVLFVANHSSHLDAPLILTSLPDEWRERTAVGAASDYFFDVWWRGIGTALAFNTFPVERAGSRRTSGLASQLLSDGWSVLVFPEGTRSRDGWMGEFRRGTARLALQERVPVLPIAIRGSYQAMPRGRSWPAPGRRPINLRFGRPLWPDDLIEAEEFSERIRSELVTLLDEDRTTWWDALRARDRDDRWDPTGPDAPRWRRMWESSRPLEVPRSRRAWPSRRSR
jgi:1-acyl-sn-glycerol-3-phosphate acyltransferase